MGGLGIKNAIFIVQHIIVFVFIFFRMSNCIGKYALKCPKDCDKSSVKVSGMFNTPLHVVIAAAEQRATCTTVVVHIVVTPLLILSRQAAIMFTLTLSQPYGP